MRRGFTLAEMTIVILIVAILAAMAIPVYSTAAQQAKAHRTRAIVSKIDSILIEKWEMYSSRPVPVRIAQKSDPVNAQAFVTAAREEWRRLELPERIGEVTDGPAYGTFPDSIPQPGFPATPLACLYSRTSANKQFLNHAFRAHRAGPLPQPKGLQYWTDENEDAECLFIILAVTRDGDSHALDWFPPNEIGDTDGDGMREILDGWGHPIRASRRVDGVLVFSQGIDANDPADDITSQQLQ